MILVQGFCRDDSFTWLWISLYGEEPVCNEVGCDVSLCSNLMVLIELVSGHLRDAD